MGSGAVRANDARMYQAWRAAQVVEQQPPVPEPQPLQTGLFGNSFLGTALQNTLDAIALQVAQHTTPPPPEPHIIEDINQPDLTVFFSQYEDSNYITGKGFTERYLTDPAMMAFQETLIQDLTDRVQAGEPPLTLEEFHEAAVEETGDPGTAFMVAHNVTKALSRGRSPIDWAKISEEPLQYEFNGQAITFDPDNFHPDAAVGANDRPSVFYAMFDVDSVGTDPGDAYHFYLNGAVAYYGATGQIHFDDDGGNPFDYESFVDRAVDGAMDQMEDGEGLAYDGWRFANTLSYLEGAKYGGDYGGGQTALDRESNIHREGALFGLEQAGVVPDPDWRWYVPDVGAANGSLEFGVDLDSDTNAILTPDGDPVVVAADNEEPAGDGGSSRD